jgi:hypothetical protein
MVAIEDLSLEDLVEILRLRADLRCILDGPDPAGDMARWLEARGAAREIVPPRSGGSAPQRRV